MCIRDSIFTAAVNPPSCIVMHFWLLPMSCMITVYCDMFRNVKENLMTSYKNDLSRPKPIWENCWKKQNSLHTSMNCWFCSLVEHELACNLYCSSDAHYNTWANISIWHAMAICLEQRLTLLKSVVSSVTQCCFVHHCCMAFVCTVIVCDICSFKLTFFVEYLNSSGVLMSCKEK